MALVLPAIAQSFNSPFTTLNTKQIPLSRKNQVILSWDSIVTAGHILPATNLSVAERSFSLPLKHLKLTSTFGYRTHPVTGQKDFHMGIDLSARSEPVFAVTAGKVAKSGYDPILGNYVRITNKELKCIYGHLSLLLVETGEEISCGQIIGISGATGRATGEHLHLSIKFQGSYIHPLQFLKGMSQSQ